MWSYHPNCRISGIWRKVFQRKSRELRQLVLCTREVLRSPLNPLLLCSQLARSMCTRIKLTIPSNQIPLLFSAVVSSSSARSLQKKRHTYIQSPVTENSPKKPTSRIPKTISTFPKSFNPKSFNPSSLNHSINTHTPTHPHLPSSQKPQYSHT